MYLRKVLSLVILMAVVISAQAQYQPNDKSVEEVLENRKEIFFRFHVSEFSGKIRELTRKISIDSFDEEDGTVYAYANESGYAYLKDSNIEIELLYNPSELISVSGFKGDRETYDWNEYPTYEAYVDMMYQFETDFPGLCRVENFGATTDGRELLAAKITDNPDAEEEEPELFYTSTMHGDETTGYVVMLRLIDYLLTNYGLDDRVTSMVDNMEIWINPNANPDGTYATGNGSVSGATRGNANGVDINRNFPDPDDGPHWDGNQYQAETLAFMDFAEAHDFVMSANFHGGAEVVNYPWDTWAQRHADDDWWQFVSHEYADTVHTYSPSNYMNEFNNGITNGYDWYAVAGGRQDYMNYFQHCRELTIELSDIKLLPESQLNNHWEYNYRSLLNYIEQASYGIRGVVADSETGDPVGEAVIEIIGHDEDNSYVVSSSDLGDYYRPVITGTYDLTFSAPCYGPVTFEGIAIEDYEAVVQNASLNFLGFNADFTAENTTVNIGSDVQFEDASCGNVTSWEWIFEGGNPASSEEQNPVVTYDTPGTYDVTLTISNGTDEETTVKEDYITAAAEFLMNDQDITACQGIFYDDGRADGNYSDGRDYTMTFYPSTSGAMIEVVFESFELEDHDNCAYDWLKIYDGESTSAPQIGSAYCGTDSPGTVTAANGAGALTFVFHSDGNVNASGWQALISCEGGSAMPMADFEADVTQIVEGEQVTFTNLSENGDSYSWTFEGGEPATSTEANPVVTYNEPGNYDVELTVTNSNGSDTELKEDFIEVGVNTAISISGDEGLKVYPNPVTNNQFVVEARQRISELAIVSLEGKLIKTLKPNAKKVLVNTSGMKGIYLIRLTSDKKAAYAKIQVM